MFLALKFAFPLYTKMGAWHSFSQLHRPPPITTARPASPPASSSTIDPLSFNISLRTSPFLSLSQSQKSHCPATTFERRHTTPPQKVSSSHSLSAQFPLSLLVYNSVLTFIFLFFPKMQVHKQPLILTLQNSLWVIFFSFLSWIFCYIFVHCINFFVILSNFFGQSVHRKM
jgi:hypothetical protein